MVCSGSSMGTRKGMLDYLTRSTLNLTLILTLNLALTSDGRLTTEFHRNVKKGRSCLKPPYQDQSIHDMLYYTGQFGPKVDVLFLAPDPTDMIMTQPVSGGYLPLWNRPYSHCRRAM